MADLEGTNPDELDVEIQQLGVDMLVLAARALRLQLMDFMAAQGAQEQSGKDALFYAEPVEVLENGRATAVGKMMFNMDWSHYLVHSADMMFSASGVVEALLNEDEEVVGVESLRFLNPVKNNLKLYACVGELSEDVSERCAQRKPDLKATFLTKDSVTGEERKIQLFGFQNNQSAGKNGCIRMAYLPNSLSRNFASWERDVDGEGNDVFIFDLAEPDSRVAETKLGSSLNAVMELVMHALSNVRKFSKNAFPKGEYNLAYGFDFKKLPETEQLNQNCKLLISVNKAEIVEKANGFRLIPVKFAIKNPRGIICEGVYTSAQAMNDEVAEAYSDKL